MAGMERDVPALDEVGLKLRQLGASHAMRVSLATAAAMQLSGTAEALLHHACHDKEAAVMQPSVIVSMAADVSGPARPQSQQSHDPAHTHSVSSVSSEAMARGTSTLR